MSARFSKKKLRTTITVLVFAALIIVGVFTIQSFRAKNETISVLQIQALELGDENKGLKETLEKQVAELIDLKTQDQFKINQELRAKVAEVEKAFSKAVTTYEELIKLRESSKSTASYDNLYTDALVLLSKQDYGNALTKLGELSSQITSEQQKIAASFTIPASVPTSNDAPSSGYSRQTVNTEIGQYLVSLVAGDLGNTRIIVDTASDSTCTNNCPVLSLGDYVARNGAAAGINGSYFCPAEYPSCAGKTNSFDTLLMNKNKTYFNSDNNVYSSVPAVIFGGSYVRFVGASSDWGRDTGIDSMIANQPLLVSSGNVVFGGDGDPKKGSRGGRSFVASKGNTAYIGVVHNATVAESAIVLKALGMENALNLDSGGSTALWSGGYKVGPGRNLPNVILFVRK